LNIQERRLENAVVELEVEVPENRVESEYITVFNKIQKNAKIDGFRAGKVPKKLLEMKYRELADRDVAENLLKSVFFDVIKEKEISPIVPPEFDFEKIERGELFSFKARFEVAPSVELGEYKKRGVEEHVCEIGEDDIKRELVELQEKRAIITCKEEGKCAEDGDSVMIKIKRIDNVEKETIDKMKYLDYNIIVGKGKSEYSFDNHVEGMMVNEEKEVAIEYPKDYHITDLAGQKTKYLLMISEISSRELPELNDEFAKEMGDFDSIDKLEKTIGENIENFVKEKVKNLAKSDVLQKIVAESKFDLPESMVHREEESLLSRFRMKTGLDEEKFEEFCSNLGDKKDKFLKNIRDEAENNIKYTVTLGEIAKNEEIKVSEEDFKGVFADIALKTNQSIEEVEKSATDNDQKGSIESELILRKALDFIYANSIIKKKDPVSMKEFMKEIQ